MGPRPLERGGSRSGTPRLVFALAASLAFLFVVWNSTKRGDSSPSALDGVTNRMLAGHSDQECKVGCELCLPSCALRAAAHRQTPLGELSPHARA